MGFGFRIQALQIGKLQMMTTYGHNQKPEYSLNHLVDGLRNTPNWQITTHQPLFAFFSKKSLLRRDRVHHAPMHQCDFFSSILHLGSEKKTRVSCRKRTLITQSFRFIFTSPLVFSSTDSSSISKGQANLPAIPTHSWLQFKRSCDTNLDQLVVFHLLPEWQSVVRYLEWHVPQGVVAGKNDAAKSGNGAE